MEEIGKIFSYYDKIGVAAIRLTSDLALGDRIQIRGNTTAFEQNVVSIQIEHEDVESSQAGDDAGIKVADKVRKNDTVYLVNK